jgi:hypothetical protein
MELLTKTIDLFHKGGPVMYLLAACSLFVVAIAVERFLYYRNISANSQFFQNKLEPLLCGTSAASAGSGNSEAPLSWPPRPCVPGCPYYHLRL